MVFRHSGNGLVLFVGLLCLLGFTSHTTAQEIVVDLTERTNIDNRGIAIEVLQKEPQEVLKLPTDLDLSMALFGANWVHPELYADKLISIMFLPTGLGQKVFVDWNNDEDLTNDGEPIWFPNAQNELILTFHAKDDSSRYTSTMFQRSFFIDPRWKGVEDLKKRFDGFEDDQGNLLPDRVSALRLLKGVPDFDGKRGTFFYRDPLKLSRGKVDIAGKVYEVALFDRKHNGHFDDDSDLFVIDLDGFGGLQPHEEKQEVFRLNEVIPIGNRRYRLSDIDPYGGSVTLVPTDENATSIYQLEQADRQQKLTSHIPAVTKQLASSFWNLKFETIDGEFLPLTDWRGRFIFLNFWGEWCGPCLTEMPDLVSTRTRFPESDVAFLGFLKTSDLAKARYVMQEYGINWPQVILDSATNAHFKVNSFPTNLLIYPDGRTYVHTGMVDQTFFEKHLNKKK